MRARLDAVSAALSRTELALCSRLLAQCRRIRSLSVTSTTDLQSPEAIVGCATLHACAVLWPVSALGLASANARLLELDGGA